MLVYIYLYLCISDGKEVFTVAARIIRKSRAITEHCVTHFIPLSVGRRES